MSRPSQAARRRRDETCAALAAAGPLVSTGELAAALAGTRDEAKARLAELVRAGRAVRVWRGCYALSGQVPSPLPPRPTAAGRYSAPVLAFIAADGGATITEIAGGTGISRDMVIAVTRHLTRTGQVTQVAEMSGRRQMFYLLPGQEPGQAVGASGLASHMRA